MTGIIANKQNLDYMSSVVKSGSVPHTVVIEGIQGSGKYTLATHFSAMINCMGDSAPCGKCSACTKIFSGVHADVTVVDLEQDKKSISVSRVREIIYDASLMPSEAKKRIFIIRNAQALTHQAQNAFLKMLEEPPKDVIFILLTHDKELLLPTVISRAVVLKSELLPTQTILEQLTISTKKNQAQLQAAANVAQGSLGKALEIANGTAILKMRDIVEKYFDLLGSTVSVYTLCQALPPQSFKRDDLSVILPFFRMAFRDLALAKSGSEFTPMFFTNTDVMKKAADNISTDNIITLYQKTDRLCLWLNSNINVYTAVSVFNAYVAEYANLK